VVRMIQAGAGLRRGDRVLVRYGRFAGRVGEVEDVFRREDAGRERDVVWVRFGDRSVEGFDPKNLVKKGDHG
jgi:KOW motif-containing protein